jgi:hypothetical protein
MLRAAIVLVLMFAPSLAHADAAGAKEAMHEYFDGEIRGGYILMGMGAAGLVAGGLFYRQGSSSPTARGAAYPLLGVGVLHVAAGIFVTVASYKRVDKFDAEIDQDHAAWVSREAKRMEGVSTQFTALKIAELVIATGGLTMAGIGWRTDRPRLKGAGLALAAEMMLTFGFDIFAARRAHEYRDQLAQVGVAPMVDPVSRAPAYVLTYGGRF